MIRGGGGICGTEKVYMYVNEMGGYTMFAWGINMPDTYI